MNTDVQALVCTCVFISLGQTPRSGIAGPQGSSTLAVSKELPDCFPEVGNHHFPITTAMWEGSDFSTSSPCLLLSVFLIIAIPVDVKPCLVVLIYISPGTRDVGHIFMCLLTTCIIFWRKYLVKFFAHFNWFIYLFIIELQVFFI